MNKTLIKRISLIVTELEGFEKTLETSSIIKKYRELVEELEDGGNELNEIVEIVSELDGLILDEREMVDGKSEKWLESDKGIEVVENLETLEDIRDRLMELRYYFENLTIGDLSEIEEKKQEFTDLRGELNNFIEEL